MHDSKRFTRVSSRRLTCRSRFRPGGPGSVVGGGAYARSVPKRPTLQDVAHAVGMSSATVSYALRGERGSDETVRRVRAAATELGYQADPIARALASGQSRTVAVLCGSSRDLWQQSVSAELARVLLANGRHALVADADGEPATERDLVSMLRDQRPDGLIVAPLDPFADVWAEVASDLPVVSLGDRLAKAPTAGAVLFDNPSGFTEVFDHLAGLGHERIVVVLPQRPSTPDRPAERLVGDEAGRHGLEALLVRTPPATGLPHDTTDHLVRALDDLRPTAAFCLTDSFAYGVLRAAEVLGLQVPRDLSVVGFENLEFSDLAGPGLTTVDWGGAAAAEAAVTQLLGAIERVEPLETLAIPPRLIVRGSTGRSRPSGAAGAAAPAAPRPQGATLRQ